MNNRLEPGKWPSRPFGMIAMSLSGGGARAAGYHLGTLAYLHRLGLLDDVEILSTVSGGTLLGMRYAKCIKSGSSFESFFDSTYKMLLKLRLLDDAFKNLSRELASKDSTRRGFAAAMADVYDRDVTEEARFGIFWEEEPPIHLKDITFNSLELHTGKFFRFRYSNLPFYYMGNKDIWIDQRDARGCRLADILAASGCLPVLMEPLNYPADFCWETPEDAREAQRRFESQTHLDNLPLLDGGIYDNQGIESLTLALRQRRLHGEQGVDENRVHQDEARHTDRQRRDRFRELIDDDKELDLIIVSDVPVHCIPVYEEPRTELPGVVTVKRVRTLLWTILLLALVALGAQTVDLFTIETFPAQGMGGAQLSFLEILIEQGPGAILEYSAQSFVWKQAIWDLISLLMIVLILIGLIGMAVLKYKAIRQAKEEILHQASETLLHQAKELLRQAKEKVLHPAKEKVLQPAKASGSHRLRELKNLTMDDLGHLLSTRGTSVWALLTEVFMNRIRALGYGQLYDNATHQSRIIAHDINNLKQTHDLRHEKNWVARESTIGRQPRPAQWLIPSKEMLEVQAEAAGLELKFHYDEGELKTLIACGQMTMCHDLLAYIDNERALGSNALHDKGEVDRIYRLAREDYKRFKTDDPLWLVEEELRKGPPEAKAASG